MSRRRAGCGVRYRHLTRKKPTTMESMRSKALGRIGFASYRDYLRSELWKAIRAEKLRQSPRCELCDCRAQCVHHICYRESTLVGKKLHKLVSLCNECHTKVEFYSDGEKRSFESAMKYTRKLLRARGRWEEHTIRGKDGISSDRDA